MPEEAEEPTPEAEVAVELTEAPADTSKKGSKKDAKAGRKSLSAFTKGKLVLARVNMLDGTIQDFNIEVCQPP